MHLRISLLLALVPACAHTLASDSAPNAPIESPASTVRAEFRGTVDLEGHLAKPGDTVPVELTWAQTCDGERCLVERTSGRGDDAHTTRIWSTPEATWVEGAPVRVNEDAAENHRRLLDLFAPPLGQTVQKVRFDHPRLGSHVDVGRYGKFTPAGIPERIEIDFTDSDIAWRGELTLAEAEERPGLEVPEPPPAASAPAPTITTIGERLWDVRVPAYDARSFVVEFESFVVVVEAPWSSDIGEHVVDLIEDAVPGKPIRYVVFSHHHPHYTGGLRAFMAAGATVVAARAHAPLVRAIGDLDFSHQPDRFAESGGEVELITYEGDYTIAENGQSLHVFDIGEQSSHTAVYNLVWLPDSRTLIEGDIGWFVLPDGTVAVNERSKGLLAAIEALELPVQMLLQSWPVQSQDPALDIEAFRAAF